MERLFGRKTKKSSVASPTNPSPAVVAEDEGFSVVSNSSSQPVYPNIANPYAANANVVKSSVEQQNGTELARSNSKGGSAYLDGVPFVLSNKCSGGADIDAILARVEGISERVRNVDWASTEYNFNLERSVVSQDLTTTMRRLNARE